MGRKPEAGRGKIKTTDPEQSARFIEAAREVGVDESGEAFERAFDKIVSPRKELSDRSPAPQRSRRSKDD